MGIYGRSKPYNTTSRYCERCGIERRAHGSITGDYCADCAPAARALGWTN